MFGQISIGATVAVFAVLALHFLGFGWRRFGTGRGPRTIKRFSVWERLVHTVTVLAFLALAVTGFWGVFEGERLHGWFWLIHVWAGAVFMIVVVLMAASWARDSRFSDCDLTWTRRLGGYLGNWGHEGPCPAERFNAGQKAFFWAVLALTVAVLVSGLLRVYPLLDPQYRNWVYQAHRYAALAFALAVIVHLYLGTIANPGTLGAMVTGKVSAMWAEHHHPQWLANDNND